MAAAYKSKSLASWLALIGGSFGLHRFYLHGWWHFQGWLYPVPFAMGLVGIERMQTFGQDDVLSWALVPLLGLVLSVSMLEGIVIGLTPDEQWHARHNGHLPDQQTLPQSGWGSVVAVVLCLMIGAAILMATMAYAGQRFFEYQIIEAQKLSQ